MDQDKLDNLNKTLNQWFKDRKDDDELMDQIVNRKSKISLRAIDWFVTNYSNKYKIKFMIPDCVIGGYKEFCVYKNYKDTLKQYHKALFDPFQRGKKIGESPEIAKIRQKNFFKWAMSNGIVDYTKEHIDEIKQDMEVRRGNKRTKKQRSRVNFTDIVQKKPVADISLEEPTENDIMIVDEINIV